MNRLKTSTIGSSATRLPSRNSRDRRRSSGGVTCCPCGRCCAATTRAVGRGCGRRAGHERRLRRRGRSRPSETRLRRAVRVAQVDVHRPRRLPEHEAVEAVALVAVGVAVLGVEVGDLRVAEGERIALVVVVRLVPGQRVVGLELVVVRPALVEAEGEPVVLCSWRSSVDRRSERADAVGPAGAEAAWPRGEPSDGVVAVEEARDVAGPSRG